MTKKPHVPVAPAFAPHEEGHLKALGVQHDQMHALRAGGFDFAKLSAFIQAILAGLLSSGVLTPKMSDAGEPQAAPPAAPTP